MTYLAVPIAAGNLADAQIQIAAAVARGAEMLEMRTDYLKNPAVEPVRQLIAAARQATDRPILVTCRDAAEGGAQALPGELRVDVLCAALGAGAEFIDLEYRNFILPRVRRRVLAALERSHGGRLILSAHNFQGNLGNLRRLHAEIAQALPAAIPKLAYMAGHINDCFEAFDLLHEQPGPLIILCMGQAGPISRILAKKLGGFLTFASVDDEAATAPGQLTIERLKGPYRYDAIRPDTQLYGVIADPVGHSLSPAIHNACLADAGLNGLYVPLLVQGGRAEFNEFMDNVLARPWLDFRGFSVTIPHKESALDFAKSKGGHMEPLAEKIGAANTIVIGEMGKLSVYNTDYAGALDAITGGLGIDRVGLKGLTVAVVGGGGVARAIVAGLCDAGANITIYNRTLERAERLAAEFGCQFAGLDGLHDLDAQLLVNCTSIGMHPKTDASPVPADCLRRDMTVFDTVYNPAETLLLKQAKAKGAKTIDGVAMFVNQAMAQFRLFTGRSGNATLMRRVVSESLP